MDPLIRTLAELFERREAAAAPVRPARIFERFDDGTVGYLPMDADCVERGGVDSGAVGDRVTRSKDHAFASYGTALAAVLAASSSVRTVLVERIVPDVYRPGDVVTATIEGRGFTPATRFEFLLPDSREINPHITQTAARFVDGETIELDLAIDADAPPIVRAGLAYDDPEAL